MRLFAALDLPRDATAHLADFARHSARDGLRLVAPENLHVTLAFLGHRPDEELDSIVGALRDVDPLAVPLRVGGAAWLPPRRPGVLAVDLEDTDAACGRLQAAVSASLVDLGVFTPEKRAFRPHVTVARVRKGARVDKDLPEPPVPMTFAATALTLYRSLLAPSGARYEPISRIPLP